MANHYKFLSLIVAVVMMSNLSAQLPGPVTFSLPPNLQPAEVGTLEYYLDTDPGIGMGTPISITPGADISVNSHNLNLSPLQFGVHRLYLRSENSSGVWSQTNAATFFVLSQGFVLPGNPATVDIVAAECYFDNDPGFGHGSAMPITQGNEANVVNFAEETNTLEAGVHRLYVRTKNSKGFWSMTNASVIYIVPTFGSLAANPLAKDVSAAEYFLDADPGFGQGISIALTPGSDVTAGNIAINISQLNIGTHRIYVRTQNTAGVWSINNISTFYIVPVNFTIPANPSVGQITAVEYFFDHDPGYGNGHFMPITPTADLQNYAIVADISGLQQDTMHTMYIRTLDGWSQTSATRFQIGTTLPVDWLSFTVKMMAGDAAKLEWRTTAEFKALNYSIERSVDGVHFEMLASILSIGEQSNNGTGTNIHTYTDNRVPVGKVYYRIKELDKGGQITYSEVVPLNNLTKDNSRFYVLTNPVQDMLRIHMGDNEAGGQLQLFDLNGRLIKHVATSSAGIQQVNVSGLASGVYIIRYVSKGKAVSAKFIKR